jgi:uncharacterized membrane protein (Fun14 family)
MKLSRNSSLLALGFLLLPYVASQAQELASPVAELATSTASSSLFLENLPPDFKFMLITLGSGGITGWAVGFTLKKFAKLAALIVGISFISLQFLAYHHFISIDWEKIQQSVPNESIERSWAQLGGMLTLNLPFAGSFMVGLLIGFRKG